MGGSTNITATPIGSGNYYAINNGTLDESSIATVKSSLRNILYWIKSATINADPTDLDVESNQYSIHWKDVRDILLPESNDFIDDALRIRYHVPFKKTKFSRTEYQKHITQIGALYCAWRIETRSYPGGGEPNDSPYAQTLRTMLNERCNEILSGATRLVGQRLKATNRFINPHIEELPAGIKQGTDQVTNMPSSVQTSYRTNEPI